MTPEQLEKRRRVMSRSMALGHCVCDPTKPCPCPIFKEKNICPCAGERVPVKDGPVRLTEHVRNVGCASKVDKGTLRRVLKGLPNIADPRVIIGSSAGDDAGVIVLSEKTGTILTVDVFCPTVDDPYTFGQIAAANSVSDIYAMGGTPQSALSIIGFPVHSLPESAMSEILRGGIDTLHDAGIDVIGGHSINDEEVKCGFAVLGTAPLESIKANRGAQPGDAIVLTKPIGVGLAAFAKQVGRVDEKAQAEITASMIRLNRVACEGMLRYGAHAATDVTGYSLLGHMSEIVRNSEVLAEIDFDALPMFTQVRELARMEVLPGAVERNREALAPEILDAKGLTEAQKYVMLCPETSGGLLVFLPQENAESYLEELHKNGDEKAAIIGRVSRAHSCGLIRVTTAKTEEWTPLKLEKKAVAAKSVSQPENTEDECCCCGGEGDDILPEPQEEDCCCCGESQQSEPVNADSCCCSQEEKGGEKKLPAPAAAPEFAAYMRAAQGAGAIDKKNKALMAFALSIAVKCAGCVKVQAEAARAAGATDKELSEAAAMGIAFGGAGSAMFYKEQLTV